MNSEGSWSGFISVNHPKRRNIYIGAIEKPGTLNNKFMPRSRCMRTVTAV
jgi:hypothetical protein